MKKEKKLRFVMTLPGNNVPENIKSALLEEPPRSGMYNWLGVFDGGLVPWEKLKDHTDDFDVIQVNMSPMDMSIIPEIRQVLDKKGRKTKLVLNNDYVCEHWGEWGLDPYRYDQIQRMGDMVFGTEKHQVSNMIEGAFTIPHPTHTKLMKRLGRNKKLDENAVGFVFHWWARESYLGSRTLRHVKEKYGATSKVVGYWEKYDSMNKFKYQFDEYLNLTGFNQFATEVKKLKCLYDPNPCHTYGRNCVEAACWGIPVIGSDRVFSQNKLFPDLACDPYDKSAIMSKFEQVFNDEKFVKSVLKKAYDGVEYFNYKNSKQRWLDAFKIAIDRGGVNWYKKRTY